LLDYDELAEELIQNLRNGKPLLETLSETSRGEIGIMLFLTTIPDGALSGEISRALHITTGRTASGLKSLENKGFIKRSADAADARKVRVSLTDAGETCVCLCKKHTLQFVSDLLKKLGSDDAFEFVRIMEKICKIENAE